MAIRKNKYNAQRVGKYDSQAEAEYAGVLKALKLAGHITDYEHHPAIVVLKGCIGWAVDYMVTGNGGEKYYVEVKGAKTETYSIKLKMWKDDPPAPLFIVRRYGEYRFKVIDEVGTENIKIGLGLK